MMFLFVYLYWLYVEVFRFESDDVSHQVCMGLVESPSFIPTAQLLFVIRSIRIFHQLWY